MRFLTSVVKKHPVWYSIGEKEFCSLGNRSCRGALPETDKELLAMIEKLARCRMCCAAFFLCLILLIKFHLKSMIVLAITPSCDMNLSYCEVSMFSA